jgi:hypothetical protein
VAILLYIRVPKLGNHRVGPAVGGLRATRHIPVIKTFTVANMEASANQFKDSWFHSQGSREGDASQHSN